MSTYKLYDNKLVDFMKKHGERVERYSLGIYFFWFGLLKIFGKKSASSIIAKTVYWFDPAFVVPALGAWEAAIGLALVIKKFHRLAVFLLLIRIPGCLLALIIHFDECFDGSILTPTIQGQYLIKELTLVGAALVIGSKVRLLQK